MDELQQPGVKVITIDEAELVVVMFEYLTGRDPEKRPSGPARRTLQAVEARIDAERDEAEKLALIVATDLTKLALQWLADATARGGAEGMVRKMDMPGVRQ